MKTITAISKAVYDPFNSRITFYRGDKPSHGFVGSLAVKKFFECTQNKSIELILKGDDNMEKSKLIQQFHAILASKGIMDMKADIVGSYGVKSTKDLTEIQLIEIIDRFNNGDKLELKQQQSIVLDLLSQLNIRGSKATGWDQVNNYLLQPRIAGKILYDMNTAELIDCQKRLRSVIHKYKAEKADIIRKSILN